MRQLENLKVNLYKFQYPKQLIDCGIKKALSIYLQDLCTQKTIPNDNGRLFITTFNPHKPSFCDMLEKSVECLKLNNVYGFEDLSKGIKK